MEKKELLQMVKTVAVLIVIALLAGILLAVVNNFTYIAPSSFNTSDLDALIASDTDLGAQTWGETKGFDELDPAIRTTKNGDTELMGYALSTTGVLGMKAKGGGFAGDIFITIVVGSDGVVKAISTEASETKGQGGNYGASAKYLTEILGKPVGTLGMVRGTGSVGPDDVDIINSGASITSNAMSKIFNLMFRYMGQKGLVSMEDPYEAIVTTINGLQSGLNISVEDLGGGFGPFAYVITKGNYTVYVTGDYTQAVIVVFNDNANEIAAIGAHGYTGTITASLKTALEGIDFDDQVTLPSAQIDAIPGKPTAAGLDKDVYDIVKEICGLKSDPDSVNEQYKLDLISKLSLPAGTKILTLYSAESSYSAYNIGSGAALENGTIKYAGVLVDGTLVFIVEGSNSGLDTDKSGIFAMAIKGNIITKFVVIQEPATSGYLTVTGKEADIIGDDITSYSSSTALTGILTGATAGSGSNGAHTATVVLRALVRVKTYLASGLTTNDDSINGTNRDAVKAAYTGSPALITLYGAYGGNQFGVVAGTNATIVYAGLVAADGTVVFIVEGSNSGLDTDKSGVFIVGVKGNTVVKFVVKQEPATSGYLTVTGKEADIINDDITSYTASTPLTGILTGATAGSGSNGAHTATVVLRAMLCVKGYLTLPVAA